MEVALNAHQFLTKKQRHNEFKLSNIHFKHKGKYRIGIIKTVNMVFFQGHSPLTSRVRGIVLTQSFNKAMFLLISLACAAQSSLTVRVIDSEDRFAYILHLQVYI